MYNSKLILVEKIHICTSKNKWDEYSIYIKQRNLSHLFYHPSNYGRRY